MKFSIFSTMIFAFVMHSSPLQAEESYESLKPYLTSSTMAVLEIDFKVLIKNKETRPQSMSKELLNRLNDLLKSGGIKKIYAVFDTSLLNRSFPFYVIPAENDQQRKNTKQAFKKGEFFLSLKQMLKASEDVASYQISEDKNVVIASKRQDQKHIVKLKSENREDILSLLKKNQGSLFSLAISPTHFQRKILEEQLPVVPGKIPNFPDGLLTKDIQSIFIVIDNKLTKTELTIESKDGKSASEVLAFIKNVYQIISESNKGSKEILLLQKNLVPLQEGKQLKLSIDHKSPAGNVIGKLGKNLNNNYFRLSQRRITFNRFKHILLATHNYYDVNKTLPARAILSKDGKPLLSWRVSILPWLEENELYMRFHLDEPWDSEHNKKLIPLMPKMYYSPVSSINREFKTTFQGLAGKKMMMGTAEALTFQKVIDGTSNTIMIVDTNDENAMIWTKPGDFVPEENPVEGLVGHSPDGFIAGMLDGSVRFISKEVDREIIRNLFMFNDRNVIPAY
jgi:Protein of unknown function (DUF1559)